MDRKSDGFGKLIEVEIDFRILRVVDSVEHIVDMVTIDEDRFPIQLDPGVNVILVKVDQGRGDWGLSLRVRGAADDLRYVVPTAE